MEQTINSAGEAAVEAELDDLISPNTFMDFNTEEQDILCSLETQRPSEHREENIEQAEVPLVKDSTLHKTLLPAVIIKETMVQCDVTFVQVSTLRPLYKCKNAMKKDHICAFALCCACHGLQEIKNNKQRNGVVAVGDETRKTKRQRNEIDKDRDPKKCDHRLEALELFSDDSYYTDKAITAKHDDDNVKGWPYTCHACALQFTKKEIKANI